jgi:hypothetical protein
MRPVRIDESGGWGHGCWFDGIGSKPAASTFPEGRAGATPAGPSAKENARGHERAADRSAPLEISLAQALEGFPLARVCLPPFPANNPPLMVGIPTKLAEYLVMGRPVLANDYAVLAVPFASLHRQLLSVAPW